MYIKRILGVTALLLVTGTGCSPITNNPPTPEPTPIDNSQPRDGSDWAPVDVENSLLTGITFETNTVPQYGTYQEYGTAKINPAYTDRIILFFKASWCSTCQGVDKDIRAHITDIPSDVAIVRVDYDNNAELKKEYGVTYQHTFVLVTKEGVMLKKWSGSPTLSALLNSLNN